jgi:hypothetical protein
MRFCLAARASQGSVSAGTDIPPFRIDVRRVRSQRGRLTRFMAGLFFLFVSITLLAARQRPREEMVGEWRGKGEILVEWSEQRELAVHLTIANSGAVHGVVGDARLVDGQLIRNRGWIGRALDIKTDYIITGRLEGCVVASEHICRESAKIALNSTEGRLVGSLHTNGTISGGKDRMVFTVAHLSLLRELER